MNYKYDKNGRNTIKIVLFMNDLEGFAKVFGNV